MNDSELVQGLRRRDPAAFQTLCDWYVPSLWRYVYVRVHGDRHLAEDITSEAVLALLIALQGEGEGQSAIRNPAGWLRTVAGRRVQDHFRAATRVRHLFEQASGTASESREADPALQSEQQERCAKVREVLDQLPDQYRVALEWKYLDKVSVKEIAVRWQTTEKAAESILFRARREFRDQLNRREARSGSAVEQNGSAAGGRAQGSVTPGGGEQSGEGSPPCEPHGDACPSPSSQEHLAHP